MGILIPVFVVPADSGIHGFNEWLIGLGSPLPKMEQFRFQSAEESLACGVVP
jgi:hypothetical protein